MCPNGGASSHLREVIMDAIEIDRAGDMPQYQQLYHQIREMIGRGVLKPEAQLPSTRALASDLRMSRNTAMIAYEQLEVEGYIETTPGARARVARLPSMDDVASQHSLPRMEGSLSRRGHDVVTQEHRSGHASLLWLQPGLPDMREFPFSVWRRLVAKHLSLSPGESFGYHSYGGHQKLREVIAEFFQSSRGLKCQADQVMVTGGAQSAFNLLAHLILDPDDTVLFEEPGYTGAQGAFLAAGANLAPLPVRGNSWSLDAVKASKPKLIYLTPSCQFPLGVTMRMDERLQLLRHARDVGAWVIEDDFDSEFRFSTRPVPTLQSNDPTGRVIYVGTFSKMLFPSLRIGFIIFPGEVDKGIRKANFLLGTSTPLFLQAALAEFIERGLLARHLRRMRRIYRLRRDRLEECAKDRLGNWLTQIDEGSGLQTTWLFHENRDDQLISSMALEKSISVTPLSINYFHSAPKQGLMIGFAATEDSKIDWALARLQRIVQDNESAARTLCAADLGRE